MRSASSARSAIFRGLAVSAGRGGGDANRVDGLIGFVDELAGFAGGSDFATALYLLAGAGFEGVSFVKMSFEGVRSEGVRSEGVSSEEDVTNVLFVAAGLVTRDGFCKAFGYVFWAAGGVRVAASEVLEGFSSAAAASEA